MAKPRCDKHKRSIPYCDACKAAVRAAEEAALQAERDAVDADAEEASGKQAVLDEALREEESKALAKGIGFPGAQKEVPETGEPVEDDGPAPMGVILPPDEPADWDGAIDKAGQTLREGEIDETEKVMTEAGEFDPEPAVEIDGDGNIVPVGCAGCPGGCDGSCQGHPDPGAEFETIEVTAEVKRLIVAIEEAISNGEGVTIVMGDAETRLRQEGRKDVIRMVREYYADSIDTNAFQLLAYLEKACK